MMNVLTKRLTWGRDDSALWQSSGDDVIAIHGPDGRFIKVSNGAETLFGLAPAEMMGRNFMDFIASEDQQALLDAYARLSSGQGSGRALFDCQLRLGRQQRSRVEISLSRTPRGHMRSVTRPIEHRLARERQIKEESAQAVSMAARRTDHLANVSHEIRTPLNAVIGFADALRTERFGPIGSDRYKDYARVIHDSGAHLESLISDLLDLSKAEAEETVMAQSVVHPGELINFVADVMRPRAEEAGLELKVALDPSLRTAMLDAKIVRQILFNLVSNALKFTKTGGVTITARCDDGVLSISVIDTGVGMSADDLALVGQRFKQARAEGVRGARGTGIGLSLSKALARVHGGELRLMSAVGQGTTALLHLPAEVPQIAPPVVDETPDNVTVLSSIKRA